MKETKSRRERKTSKGRQLKEVKKLLKKAPFEERIKHTEDLSLGKGKVLKKTMFG